jgi:RNase P subunit RPR2
LRGDYLTNVEVTMYMLEATCPRCRTSVDTGLTADEQMIKSCQDLRVLVLCDECREYQKMLVKDLYLTHIPGEMAA